MKLQSILNHLTALAHPSLQESYDNAGLIVGNVDMDITGILVSLDSTEPVVDEAIERNCNLIVAHHPIVFKGLKRFTGSNYVERTIIKAIKNDVAIYAIHTNLDNVLHQGVNQKIAEKLKLQNVSILSKKQGILNKLVVFTPLANADEVRNALFSAGAGQISDYEHCSFNIDGTGTFKAGQNSTPYVGEIGKDHHEKEIRIEVVVPNYKLATVLRAMNSVHPYEEVAYDVYAMLNDAPEIGAGIIGELEKPFSTTDFLAYVKTKMQTPVVRYTRSNRKTIQKVAVCGGSGSFLISNAMRCKADAYITGDVKYHEFFDSEDEMMICDIGHFESEQFTIELLVDFLSKKMPNFAVLFTKTVTNPVNYFY